MDPVWDRLQIFAIYCCVAVWVSFYVGSSKLGRSHVIHQLHKYTPNPLSLSRTQTYTRNCIRIEMEFGKVKYHTHREQRVWKIIYELNRVFLDHIFFVFFNSLLWLLLRRKGKVVVQTKQMDEDKRNENSLRLTTV